MKIKVLLINSKGYQFREIENHYEQFNKLVSWNDAWNTPSVVIDGHNYTIICSDLGKVRHDRVSCITMSNIKYPSETLREPFMVGDIVVTKFDGNEDFESLNNEDIERLSKRIFTTKNKAISQFYNSILIID